MTVGELKKLLRGYANNRQVFVSVKKRNGNYSAVKATAVRVTQVWSEPDDAVDPVTIEGTKP